MAERQPNIADFRSMLDRGYGAVRDLWHARPNDKSLQNVLCEYHRMFGMLDAMTPEERSSPLAVIDSGRICRIARGAGTTDQELIQLLFSYRDYCEQVHRANWTRWRGTA